MVIDNAGKSYLSFTLLLVCCGLLCSGSLPLNPSHCFAGDLKTETLQQKEASREQLQSHKGASEWAPEREQILSRLRELQTRHEALKIEIARHSGQLTRLEESRREAERRTREADRIKLSLDSCLQEVVGRLGALTSSDLPFLTEERRNRLSFLQTSLADMQLSPSEKLRRTLEALQVEASYGKSIEKTRVALDMNGAAHQVYLFRLGRLALFYQSLDGKNVGVLNRESGKWEALPLRKERKPPDRPFGRSGFQAPEP